MAADISERRNVVRQHFWQYCRNSEGSPFAFVTQRLRNRAKNSVAIACAMAIDAAAAYGRAAKNARQAALNATHSFERGCFIDAHAVSAAAAQVASSTANTFFVMCRRVSDDLLRKYPGHAPTDDVRVLVALAQTASLQTASLQTAKTATDKLLICNPAPSVPLATSSNTLLREARDACEVASTAACRMGRPEISTSLMHASRVFDQEHRLASLLASGPEATGTAEKK